MVSEGYKQTEIGVFPSIWKICAIGDVVKLINGCAFKPEDWKTNGVPIIRIQNLNNQNAPYNYYDKKVDSKYHVKFGDVLFAWSGTKDLSFGARIWHGDDAILNQHIFKVIPDQKKLTPYYTFLVLQQVQKEIERQAHGFKSSLVHVKKSDLINVQLPVPPINEQIAMEETLSDVEKLIAALDKLIAKKRDIKTGTMQQLLTGKKRLPGFNGRWKTCNLGSVCEIISGGTPSTSNPSFWGGNIPWCTPTDITSANGKHLTRTARRITEAGLQNSAASLLPKGALLLCTRATIGEVKIATSPIATNQGFKSLVCRPGTSNEYIYYLLLTLKPRLIEKGVGSTFLEVSKKDIPTLEIKLPLEEEQIAIATILSDMDAEISALENRRAKTQAIKQGMMQELLTGRTRLNYE